MRRKGLWLILLVAVVIASVCWTRWSLSSHYRANTRVLADGSVVRLKEAAFGHKIRVRTANRWQDHLGMVLPEPWAKKLEAGFLTVGDSNRFAVSVKMECREYLSWVGGPGLRATTFDQHGCEFELATPNQSFSWSDGYTMVFVFAEYPRRERTVGLRLYQPGKNQDWKVMAEFQVPNPNPKSAPVWKAEAKPITKEVNGEEFVLLELKTGIVARQSPPAPVKPGEKPGVAINFQLPKNGEWELENFNGISDALGQKVARGSYTSVKLRNGQYQVCVDGGLCVEEAAWKVEAEFARKDRFPERELWTVRGVPVPKKGEASLSMVETNMFGASLSFQGIAQPQSAHARAIKSVRLDLPAAHIVCPNLPMGVQIKFVRGMDDAGRSVVGRGTGTSPPDYLFGLQIPEGAKTVDLTFAVTKAVAVSYLVKPGKFTAEELRKIRETW